MLTLSCRLEQSTDALGQAFSKTLRI